MRLYYFTALTYDLVEVGGIVAAENEDDAISKIINTDSDEKQYLTVKIEGEAL